MEEDHLRVLYTTIVVYVFLYNIKSTNHMQYMNVCKKKNDKKNQCDYKKEGFF